MWLWLDRLVAGMLAPLAMWVLASGLDDLFLDLCAIWFWFRDRRRPRQQLPPRSGREKKIALLIPAWREDAVIEHMLDHNIAAIQYSNYEIFLGVYPNDLRTLSRVAACERRYERVHRVVCPHDGPTSKADCLNWIYQGLLLWEETRGCHFEVVLHHDAEDLIHPASLDWINRYADSYDMVQVPVLPLATPWWEFTHGAYCDEFAESQLRNLRLRQRLGGFLPSCGVGTAYRRRALDRLGWNNGGQLFQPDCLTEDYRIGLDLHRLGCSQILLEADRLAQDGRRVATREYFPRRLSGAIRQKARWVAGICLQCWQTIGWDAGPRQLYWLWRDRKGLLGNPLTILANLVFLYGLGRWLEAKAAGHAWGLPEMVSEPVSWLLACNTLLIVARSVSRAACVWRVYGWRHGLIAPVRSLWGNLINFAATVRAAGLFLAAEARGEPVRWLKTDHHYPSRQMLMPHKRRLGQVLVEMRLLPQGQIEQALRSLPPGERLGEHLVRRRVLSESELYSALAAQQNLPFESLDATALTGEAFERLPLRWARRLEVIPVRVTHGRYLWVAGPELPDDGLAEQITRLTSLQARFQLITPTNYRRLRDELEVVPAPTPTTRSHAGS
jgi:adsorption protein B